MEPRSQRRLLSVLRHILPGAIAAGDLHPNLLYARESKLECSFPVIIGGMVLDIHAKPFTPAKPGTTTPGKVEYVRGGVSRNVAECMSKLWSKPFLISVVGLDMPGELLLEYWKSSGLPMDGILKHPGISTPVVSNIFDVSGELAAAVASVEAVVSFFLLRDTLLNPILGNRTKQFPHLHLKFSMFPNSNFSYCSRNINWIQQFRHHISSAPILMLDANLLPSSLEAACHIAAEYRIPVWFEPVSVSKSKRIAPIAKHVTFASPNEAELFAMANALSSGDAQCSYKNIGERQSVEDLLQDLKPAICILLEKGIKFLVVTLGADGVFLCSGDGAEFSKSYVDTGSSSSGLRLCEIVNENFPSKQSACTINPEQIKNHAYILHLPALPASVMSLTGAGDCLVGGTLASVCAGLNVMQSIAVGISAATAAVETRFNVPHQYDLTRIAGDVKRILCAAKLFWIDHRQTLMQRRGAHEEEDTERFTKISIKLMELQLQNSQLLQG
ncbi:hypothetical protein Taro_015496, partial [Colocasia esculenta]|nr:hypothetical protein [Colocasia esculenta]